MDVVPHKKITKGMSVDTDILPVSFGGFTPMALTDANMVGKDVGDVYDRMARQRDEFDALKRFEEEKAKYQFIGWHYVNGGNSDIVVNEEAREVVMTEEDGTEWRFDMNTEGLFRITGCQPNRKDLWLPSQVGETPVVEIASDAFASLHDIEEIYVPDTITRIGLRSFLDCRNLRRLVLPRYVDEFTAQWVRGCARLEELYLPGALEKIDAQIFDAGPIKKLFIGEGTSRIEPGCFEKSAIQSVEVSPENPYLMTDGDALYSKDAHELIVLVRPLERFVVPEGVTHIAKKAFYSRESLREVLLPQSVEELGPFCFGRTGLSSIELPPNVKKIGEKAFFFCDKLQSVCLNDALTQIDDEAFSNSGLTALELPASLDVIGKTITLNSKVVYSGPDATFCVSPRNERLEMDACGGLYRLEQDGLHFARMMDPATETYAVLDGAVAVDQGSFAGHARIRSVSLPDSVKTVKGGAFKGCRNLKECLVAPSLERIEEEAFLDTALEHFTVPAALGFLGTNALVTRGAHTGVRPSLRKVEVQQGNAAFFYTSGLLCRRYESGRCGVILFDNSEEDVVIPPETFSISSYAFSGATCIRTLTLPESISSIDICGLKVEGLIENIHIDLAKPYRGHESFDIRFPDTDRGRQNMRLALSVKDHVDMDHIFSNYDYSIGNATSFDTVLGDQGLTLYDQSCRIIERLVDPCYMTSSNKLLLESFIKKDLANICVAIARKDDRRSLDNLFDLGFLNEETLLPVIDRVGSLQDAAMTGYLLEVKRRLFKQDVIDFDL